MKEKHDPIVLKVLFHQFIFIEISVLPDPSHWVKNLNPPPTLTFGPMAVIHWVVKEVGTDMKGLQKSLELTVTVKEEENTIFFSFFFFGPINARAPGSSAYQRTL